MFNVTESSTHTGFFILEATEGEFSGVKFHYSDVSFPETEEPTLSFTYTVTEGEEKITPENKKIFENLIGDYLINIIERYLEENKVVYANGTDEPNQP